ncbi:hypothetical protein BDV06DRAFT_200144, partial [Aspergillus oleicola]
MPSVLTNLAVLVDYYECYDAVAVFVNLWISSLRHDVPTALDTAALSFIPFNFKALDWLLIAWVFQDQTNISGY